MQRGQFKCMQVRQLKISDFTREALSTKIGRKFITLNVHGICLQHVGSDAASPDSNS